MDEDGIRDEDLLMRLRQGDRNALGRLYVRYRLRLYGYCFRLLRNTAEAEDAVHETFLKVSGGADSLTATGAFRSWVFRIARNESLMILRRKHGHRAADPDELSDETTPLEILMAKDAGEVVRRVLDRLRVDYRDVLLLREVEGLSYAEIALVTEATLDSVKSRIFKARKALQQNLERWKTERSEL